MSGRIDFSMTFSKSSTPQKSNQDSSYRIYLVGNFSGQAIGEGAQPTICRIDIDHFDHVMAKMAPSVRLPSNDALTFEDVDAFSPDRWLDKVPLIADLLALRRDLENPRTAAAAIERIQAFTPAVPAAPLLSESAATESTDDMFLRLLGKKPENDTGSTSNVHSWIRSLVAPHIVPNMPSDATPLLQTIDASVDQMVRTILHSGAFRELESLWRATYMLVSDEAVEPHDVFLVDVGDWQQRAQHDDARVVFAATLREHRNLDEAGRDVLMVVDRVFDDDQHDLALIQFWDELAGALGGYLLSGMSPGWVNRLNENANPTAVDAVLVPRHLKHSCLAYPRYLVRLPYGKRYERLESIDFEEYSPEFGVDQLLWGNPGYLLARGVIAQGDGPLMIGDIASFSYYRDGESVLQPATEQLLSEAEAQVLLHHGILPLIGYRQRPGVLLPVRKIAAS